MHSKRSQEGYLMVDHRASPGLTEADWLKLPENVRAETQPMKGLFESPTIRCCHCGTIVILNPARTRARGYCARCDHYRCDSPACVECFPFTARVELGIEAAIRATTP
jgi:hypothetical protein